MEQGTRVRQYGGTKGKKEGGTRNNTIINGVSEVNDTLDWRRKIRENPVRYTKPKISKDMKKMIHGFEGDGKKEFKNVD